MKLQQVHKTVLRLILAVSCLFFAIPIGVYAAPGADPSRAYFKEFGADVMTGGWFMSGNSPCDTSSTSNYQDPSFTNAGYAANADTGGILGYSVNNASRYSAGGASSEYGAFSLGNVDGSTTATNYFGFYSAGAQAAKSTTISRYALTFANTGTASASYWGGQYNGTVRQQNNCVPDYYSTKVPASLNPLPNCGGVLCDGTPSGVYSLNSVGSAFGLTGADVNIGNSGGTATRITIFVNGDVYIGNNIRYTLDKESDVPKFALVVKGSIYIDPSVTQLDGLYIAQPNPSDPNAYKNDTGDIWTCHSNQDQTAPSYTDIANCTNKLTINGALIAKQVNFLRMNGDVTLPPVTSGSGDEDTLSNAQSSTNLGELVNYTPAMEIGGPFFNPGTQSSLPIDSLISLPPSF